MLRMPRILRTLRRQLSKLTAKRTSDSSPTEEQNQAMEKIIGKTVLAAIIIGLIVTSYFILQGGETFSALYIKPDSYNNYINGSYASFTYGVGCYEGKPTDYTTDIFLGEESIGKNQFRMSSGEKEWNVGFNVPDNIEFPVKVKVVLTTEDTEYETHYWLKGRIK